LTWSLALQSSETLGEKLLVACEPLKSASVAIGVVKVSSE